MRIKTIVVALLAVPLAAQAQVAKPQTLSNQDCATVIADSDAGKYTRTVDDLVFCEAWNQGMAPGEERLVGYVFRRPLPLAGQEAYLLVGINEDGTIARVFAAKTDLVEEEFLAQLAGKGMQANWQIARTPEDLLHLPAMIKAMRGKPALSENIVSEMKEILILAHDKVLKRKASS